MFICCCHTITDRDIHAAIEAGHTDLSQIMTVTKAGTQCGSCIETVAEMLTAKQTKKSPETLCVSGIIPSAAIYRPGVLADCK